MRFSKFFLLVALAGCDPMQNPPLSKDLSVRDFNIIAEDLLGTDPDMTMTAPADMKAPGGCIQLATWPKHLPVAYYDAADMVTAAAYADAMALPFKALTVEDWHLASPQTYPKNHTFTAADNYNTCDVCATVLDCDATNGCDIKFFAQGGTVSVTKADEDEVVGRMTATATNLKLVEWDFMNDVAVTNGACYEVASMTWDIPWDDRPDLGAGGNDMTGAVTDMTPPDFSNADFGACHLVINEVLTAMAGNGQADSEFVEIYNPCVGAFNTTGWKIVYRSRTGTNDLLVANLPAQVASGEYLLYISNQYATTSTVNDAGVMETGRTMQALAAAGGGLALRNNTNQIVDSVAWGSATNAFREGQTAPAPAPAPFPGTSIARRTNSPIDTNNNRFDFVADSTPSPKAAN